MEPHMCQGLPPSIDREDRKIDIYMYIYIHLLFYIRWKEMSILHMLCINTFYIAEF